MKKTNLLLSLICIILSACSSEDELEPKQYFTVFVEEYCINGFINTTDECTQWKYDNEEYLTGNGTVSGYGVSGYTKHWTRYFYDTESNVKSWSEKPTTFTIYYSEKSMDKFTSRYYIEKMEGVKYETVPIN